MMQGNRTWMVVSIILSASLFIVIALSFTHDIRRGEIEINISNPRGVPLNNMRSGDRIEGSFETDSPLTVFLMTRDEARSLREPSYYDDNEPREGIAEGSQGRFQARIQEDGDYEIMFWNRSFFRVHSAIFQNRSGKGFVRSRWLETCSK